MAKFWRAPWLDGRRPMDIAPLFFERSKWKNCTINKALHGDFWISQINNHHGLSLDHIVQFSRLWEKLQTIDIDHNTFDAISCTLTNDSCYSSKLAYAMQFLGQTFSCMKSLAWKPWAPPKYKTFALLIIQNRLWTADRLQRRGWPNCGICKLCNRDQE
jgi:hypothetical protein